VSVSVFDAIHTDITLVLCVVPLMIFHKVAIRIIAFLTC